MKLRTALSYDDVLLVPQYSEIDSRKDISLKSVLDEKRGLEFEIPLITSPMDTVTETKMAVEIARLGGLGIVHRYNSKEQQLQMLAEIEKEISLKFVGFAIGVTDDSLERALSLTSKGAKILCVDVAHGHLKKVGDFIRVLKEKLPEDVHLMAGNVATFEGALFLQEAGADSLRCSVGSGSICSSRTQTGFGIPVWQTLYDIVNHVSLMSDKTINIPLIADGGIKNSGDFAKALAVGADFGMVGSLISGTLETPGQIFNKENNVKVKCYRGMASREAQHDWHGKSSSVEGISTFVRYKGPVEPIVQDIITGLKSAFSYTGAHNLTEFQAKAEFVIQTQAGQFESSTHILSKSAQ